MPVYLYRRLSWPDRTIRCLLLWSGAPRLMKLPDALLDAAGTRGAADRQGCERPPMAASLQSNKFTKCHLVIVPMDRAAPIPEIHDGELQLNGSFCDLLNSADCLRHPVRDYPYRKTWMAPARLIVHLFSMIVTYYPDRRMYAARTVDVAPERTVA